MKGKKVYVYIKEMVSDYDQDIFIEVYESKNDAIARLALDRDAVIGYWKDDAPSGVIETNNAMSFSACEDGNYDCLHDNFYILEKTIK